MNPFIRHLFLFFILLLVACNRDTNNPTPTLISQQPTIASPSPTATLPLPTPTNQPAEPTYLPTFVETDCPFDFTTDRQLTCGYVQLPEDRTQPDGNQVQLAVAIFASESSQPAADPIIYLEGGPGGDALEILPFVFEDRFAPFLADRDLILFDQRGTGYSQPSLDCPEYTALVYDTLEENATLAEELEWTMAALAECRQRLTDEGVNLAAYNSVASAADLDDIRQALGYDQWNLWGISYGTRLALTTMRDYPTYIRSVILDSSYPLEVNLAIGIPPNLVRAFDTFFVGCANDSACNTAYPDLENRFYTLIDQLNAEPITIPVRDVFTGEMYDTPFNGYDLVGILFQSLYSSELIPVLPQMLTDTANGEYDSLSLLLSTFLANTQFFSIGMQFSVQCHEEVSFTKPGEAEQAAAAYPELEEYFNSSPNTSETSLQICADWGAGVANEIENQPVVSNIPTLVMAGEYDPITPPDWGKLVQANLANSYFFEFPGVGHGATASGDCPLSMALAFLQNPNQEPDSGCMSGMSGPDFAISGEINTDPITLVPFTADIFGLVNIEGLVPEGWQESSLGAYTRGQDGLDQTTLLQQAAPGISADLFLSLFTEQLGLTETPALLETIEDEQGRSWSVYRSDLQGLPVDLVLTEAEGVTFVVMLVSDSLERDFLFENVVVPALSALTISE